MTDKNEIIHLITDQIEALAHEHFGHPDTIAKLYGACREVEAELTRRMEQIREKEETENGIQDTIKARDKSFG